MRIYEFGSILSSVGLTCLLGSAIIAGVAPAAAETHVASWNMLHLGWDNGKDYEALAQIGGAFDLIALQEVMSPEGLDTFENALEQITGEPWSSMASEAIGRGQYKEHYAFVWRDSEVTWIDGAVVYLDDRDAFAREPMSARFETSDGYRFILASVHSIYGETIEGREFEADALASYHDWLTTSFPDTPVFIAGDFNLPPDNPAWHALGAVASPLITEGATTLSKTDGRFANLYDNIWAPAGVELPLVGVGIMDFPKALGISHMAARDSVSDHVPVYMTLDPSDAWITLQPHFAGDPQGVTRLSQVAAVGPDTSGTGEIRGNRNSMIFHRPDCPSYAKVSSKNLVTFESPEVAISAGYRIAGNCP